MNKNSEKRSILDSRNILIAVSFILAVIVWANVSITSAAENTKTIKNVKVDFDSSITNQLKYEAFGLEDTTVDVEIKGPRYKIGSLSSDDIVATAKTSGSIGVGRQTLSVTASLKNSDSSIEVLSVSSSTVEAYIDIPKTVNMEITPNVQSDTRLLSSSGSLITTDPILSQTTVTLYGPETQINKIENVYANCSSEGNLTSTTTYDATLSIEDSDGESIDYVTAKNLGSLTVTVPVYEIGTYKATVEFINSPSSYIKNPPSVTISPSTITAGVETDKKSDTDSIVIGIIDFSTLSSGTNTYEFKGSNILNGVAVDEDQVYTVTVDMGDQAAKTVSVDNSETVINNENPDFDLELLSDTMSITVLGPEDTVDDITEDDITITADLTGVELSEGTNSIPVTVTVNSGDCWAYGTYTVKVTATKTATNN